MKSKLGLNYRGSTPACKPATMIKPAHCHQFTISCLNRIDPRHITLALQASPHSKAKAKPLTFGHNPPLHRTRQASFPIHRTYLFPTLRTLPRQAFCRTHRTFPNPMPRLLLQQYSCTVLTTLLQLARVQTCRMHLLHRLDTAVTRTSRQCHAQPSSKRAKASTDSAPGSNSMLI